MSQVNSRNGNTLLESGFFPPCRAATTGSNITLAGLQTIDGITLNAGDRVLVKDQVTQTQNGIYTPSTGNWVRTSDAASSSRFFDGMCVVVAQGTVNGQTIFMCSTTDDPVIIGTSLLTFVLFSKLAPSAANSFKGNNTGSTANAIDLTIAQAQAMLGGWSNTRLAKTANYSVTNADKTSTVALGGTSFFTLTFAAVSGYDANFAVAVVNEDTGRGKVIALNGLASFILWPGQSVLVYRDSGTWKVIGRARWALSGSTTFYVDNVSGSDSNDGLAAGAGALASFAQAWANLVGLFDVNNQVVTIQLASGQSWSNLYANGNWLGASPAIIIDGGTCTITGSGGNAAIAISSGLPSPVRVQNATLTSSGGGACLNCVNKSLVLIGAGVTFASAGTSNHIVVATQAVCTAINNYTISGGAAAHLYADAISMVDYTVGITITITGTPTITNFVVAVMAGLVYLPGSLVTFSGSVHGAKYFASLCGIVNTATGDVSHLPGDSVGNATAGGQYA